MEGEGETRKPPLIDLFCFDIDGDDEIKTQEIGVVFLLKSIGEIDTSLTGDGGIINSESMLILSLTGEVDGALPINSVIVNRLTKKKRLEFRFFFSLRSRICFCQVSSFFVLKKKNVDKENEIIKMKKIEQIYPVRFECFLDFYRKLRNISPSQKKATYILKNKVPNALATLIGSPSEIEILVKAKITNKKIEATTEQRVGSIVHVVVITTYTPCEVNASHTAVHCNLVFMNTSAVIQNAVISSTRKQFENEKVKNLKMIECACCMF